MVVLVTLLSTSASVPQSNLAWIHGSQLVVDGDGDDDYYYCPSLISRELGLQLANRCFLLGEPKPELRHAPTTPSRSVM